jgi:catechol 2,3-dioxygenase-like lactoylglutathione lyase family enzyme
MRKTRAAIHPAAGPSAQHKLPSGSPEMSCDMSLGFDHMTLVVTDLPAAQQFLGVLGFKPEKSVVVSGETISSYMGIADWESDHVTLVMEGVSPRQEVQLLYFHHPVVTIDENSGFLERTGFNHVCFRTEDLDETLERFAAIGHKPRNEIMEFHDRRLVFLDGPAGVVFELAQWTSSPPTLEG